MEIARKRKYHAKCEKGQCTFGQSDRVLTGQVIFFLDSSLKGSPTIQSKNITHNPRLPLISEAGCLWSCWKLAAWRQSIYQVTMNEKLSLGKKPAVTPQLSWSLAREHKSVGEEGRQPLGSSSHLLTRTQNGQEADECTKMQKLGRSEIAVLWF